MASAAPSVRLIYLREPGAECADENAVRAAVATRLGYDPFVAFGRETLFAEVKRAGATYKASVKLVDENNTVRGARELSVPTTRCNDLIDTMALSISIAIDPLSLAGPRPPPPPEEAPPLTPAPPPPSNPEPKSPPTPTVIPTEQVIALRPADVVHLEGAIGPSLWIGSAPAPAIGANLNLLLRWRRLGVLAEGRIDAPSSSDVGNGASVRSSLLLGSLGVCGHWAPFFGCALGSVGQISASSSGILRPRDDSALHAELALRAGVQFGSTWFFRAHVDVPWTITPSHFDISGENVYSLPRFSLGISFLGGVQFF